MKNVTVFVLCCALATLLGMLLYASSTGYALAKNGALSANASSALLLQVVWVGCGILAFWFVAQVDYRTLPSLAVPLLTVSWVLMLSVYIPHLVSGHHRATSCLPLCIPSFYPARWALPASILYLSTTVRKELPDGPMLDTKHPTDWLLTGILCTTLLLVAASGGLRPPILLFLTMQTMTLAANRCRVAARLTLFSFLLFLIYLVSDPFRLNTALSSFSGPAQYCDTPITVRIFRHAGWGGIGLGNSYYRQIVQPHEIPDFLTFFVGEELGWACALALVGCVIGIILSGAVIAFHAPDRFGRHLAGGLVAYLFFQTLLHVAAVLNWFPLCITIIPMPFISELGCNTGIPLVCAGLLLSIARKTDQNTA